MMSAAPSVIAESATLNAGQCQPRAWKSRKSTTWPKRKRSITLPIAPPRISARPVHSMRRPGERTISVPTMPIATSAKTMSAGVCQPAASERKLNAAPLLYTSTILKNPVTSRRSPSAKRPSTIALVTWSAATTAAASANQRHALSMAAALTRAVEVQLAAAAQRLIVDVGTVVPAALAFAVRAWLNLHFQRPAMHMRRGGQHYEFQILAQAPQQLVVGTLFVELDLGLQRRADLARGAQRLDFLAHRIAQLAQPRPLREEPRRIRGLRQLIPRMEEHAVVLGSGERVPQLFCGEGQDRRHQPHQALRDVMERALRRAARRGIGLAGVEPVLEDVEVEGAEILRAEREQALRHEMELVALVIRAHRLLHLRGYGERVAIDLHHLGHWHGVAPRIEVRGVGEQEAQRVAQAPVALDDALQDLAGEVELARVIAARHPQAQDLRAINAGNLLWRHAGAARLRHLAAFHVDDEAMREECPVGRHAVEHARDEQRRMEPAAVLVRAFEVEVGRKARLLAMRAAQHREVRGARIEPYVERVPAFLVLGRLGSQELLGGNRLPGFDAAFCHSLGHLLEQLLRARMQRARL